MITLSIPLGFLKVLLHEKRKSKSIWSYRLPFKKVVEIDFRGDVIFGRQKYLRNLGLERWFRHFAQSTSVIETIGLAGGFLGTFDDRKSHHPGKSNPTILFPLEKIVGFDVSGGTRYSKTFSIPLGLLDHVWCILGPYLIQNL